ncbi:hypothetical protein [Anaerofustis butyriciformans]|uniref:hypothetical protein n=1 Tax=Anaerofustis butyriciformans TaxID=3108533 RepID=UPI002E363949|nr:hypothetical protein [Anaerofustis sp. HA2171]
MADIFVRSINDKTLALLKIQAQQLGYKSVNKYINFILEQSIILNETKTIVSEMESLTLNCLNTIKANTIVLNEFIDKIDKMNFTTEKE